MITALVATVVEGGRREGEGVMTWSRKGGRGLRGRETGRAGDDTSTSGDVVPNLIEELKQNCNETRGGKRKSVEEEEEEELEGKLTAGNRGGKEEEQELLVV